MIASLKGTLLDKSPGSIIVDVHGVGYRVFVPLSAFSHLPELDKPVTLHVHTHVREDAIQLYGFRTPEERDLFVLLIGISGIGPKSAIAILSGFSVTDLVEVVARGDEARLASVPGIGKKTAARVVLELREKLSAYAMRGSGPSGPRDRSVGDDVLSALVNLGYPRQQAQEAIDRIWKEQGDETSLESLLRATLKALSRG